jgi:hypothetical protein
LVFRRGVATVINFIYLLCVSARGRVKEVCPSIEVPFGNNREGNGCQEYRILGES